MHFMYPRSHPTVLPPTSAPASPCRLLRAGWRCPRCARWRTSSDSKAETVSTVQPGRMLLSTTTCASGGRGESGEGNIHKGRARHPFF